MSAKNVTRKMDRQLKKSECKSNPLVATPKKPPMTKAQKEAFKKNPPKPTPSRKQFRAMEGKESKALGNAYSWIRSAPRSRTLKRQWEFPMDPASLMIRNSKKHFRLFANKNQPRQKSAVFSFYLCLNKIQ